VVQCTDISVGPAGPIIGLDESEDRCLYGLGELGQSCDQIGGRWGASKSAGK
jgi:hypothetical protein